MPFTGESTCKKFCYNVHYRSSSCEMHSNLQTRRQSLRIGKTRCILFAGMSRSWRNSETWVGSISDSNHRRYRSRIGGFKTIPGRALRDRVQVLFAFQHTYIHGNSAITLSGTILSVSFPAYSHYRLCLTITGNPLWSVIKPLVYNPLSGSLLFLLFGSANTCKKKKH